MPQPGKYEIAINTETLGRYLELCEDVSNKSGGQKLLDAAMKNNGTVDIEYKSKYNVGRRYSKGPCPAKTDNGSRACAMYGTNKRDVDQKNSVCCIVLHIGRVLAMPSKVLAPIINYKDNRKTLLFEIIDMCSIERKDAKNL